MVAPTLGHGSGSSLPLPVLLVSGTCTAIATGVSAMSIAMHLKNYRKPHLQRQVVRIMLMVPLYAIASFISLFSLEAAFFIDAVRDIYEAFVIYCFFDLLIAYLGGERSLLILLHGRPPKYPVFPGNLVWKEVDVSDPYTFLFLKRGIIQYVQIKPLLAIATIILKALGKYNEGDLAAGSGYLYVSVVYNFSICLALYCLAIFWMCVNDDLKPFRPMPKFLCVKGILFFSFWQGLFISVLVAGGAIKKLGPYTDSEHISLGLIDTLICLEMPIFALAHMYAFATRDYVDPHTSYVARLPVFHAFKDAFGLRDVVEDVKTTLNGEGMDYREFEPSEGQIHQGAGRDRRIRAGLRYSQGGKRKYWLPQPATSASTRPGLRVPGRSSFDDVHAPLLPHQAADAVHAAAPPDDGFGAGDALAEEGYELPFDGLDDTDEALFEHSKRYLFGDYNYPCVDVSSETARKTMWVAEERILRHEHSAWFSPLNGPRRPPPQPPQRPGGYGYGATENAEQSQYESNGKGKMRGSGPGMPEIIIDKETERLPPPERLGGVQLRWTSAKPTPAPSPRASPVIRSSPTLRALGPLSRTSSASPQTGSGPSSRGSPKGRPSPSPRPDSETPILPPDAVDLVVEDPHASEAEMTHERRKGEPAVRGGGAPRLHRVYRRGYLVEEEDGVLREGGEVEIAPQGRDVFDIGEEEDPVPEEVMDVERQAVEERTTTNTIARAETPSLHARVLVDVPDDNPWA